jgi:hypothetical protein
MAMKRFFLATPFLFTLSFLLYTNHWILTLAAPNQFIRLLLALWLLLGLLMYPAYLVTRNWERASALLTVFVAGFYFSQSFFNVVGPLVLLVIALWQVYFRLRGLKIQQGQLFVILNSIALSIIVFSLYVNILDFAQVPWMTYLQSVKRAQRSTFNIPSTASVKPDIYYIVLDGYLRSDMLEALYGYDNTEFEKYLQINGFVVPGGVHSNYPRTAVSISSTLNMDYVDSFSPGLENSRFWWLMQPYIDHSQVRAILEAQGYKTIALSTDWSLTDNSTTDIYLHPYPIMLTDFERYFLEDTAMGYVQPVIREFASVPTFETHRTILMNSFASLKEIPQISGPKFIFAHILAPHPPFVFDENGNPVDPPGQFNMDDSDSFHGSEQDYQNGYIGQVKFLNTQMKIVLEAILKQSKTPPVIIIQADHGSGLFMDSSSAENTCVKERFSPFAAYYLPGVESDVIPSNITPVNLFRIILNQYFGANLPMLENEQYYYKDKIFLYRLVDVTARTEDVCINHN